jgi:hypothetical protein
MTDEAATTQTETAPEAAAAVAPAATTTAADAPEDVASLPDWTQKMIRDLRAEAATNRTKASAAEQTRQSTMDAIAKALGLKDDDDPAKAAQTAAEERDAARKEAKAVKVENAILRMATKHGANPEALTDSRSFMHALDAMDPAADDFAEQVENAIKTAVEANVNLKSAPPAAAAPARSGGPVGGGAPVAGQLGEDDLKGMSPAEIVKAKEDGRLNRLLGIMQ